MSLSKNLGFEETFIKKIGGLIANPKIVQWFNGGSCVVLTGFLMKDEAGRFADRSPVRTSWIEHVTYNSENDVTTIETRNTLYFTTGNLIEEQLAVDKHYLDGVELLELVESNLSDWKHIG